MTRDELEEFLAGYDENIINRLEKEKIVAFSDLYEYKKVWIIRQIGENFQVSCFIR